MENDFVIWSFKHKQWWREGRAGYTPHLEQAGVYTAEDAGDIVTSDVMCQSIAMYLVVAEKFGPPTVSGLWQ
jgi:hypothetical protein